MSKIAALQLPTLSLSNSRLDYYLKIARDNDARLVVLGEYVLNSFFTELLSMPRTMIKEQSLSKKESLIELAKRYELQILAPFVEVGARSFKKLCLSVDQNGIKSYEQQILMPYEHWNEEKFFSNKCEKLKLFTFSYNELKCALMFGFEVHFDEFWQEVRAKKVDLVIVPCACAFNSQQRWLELLKTRAFLNSVNILRINRIGTLKTPHSEQEWYFYGDTFFINAYAELVDKLGDKEEMLIIEPSKADEARKLWGFEKLIKKHSKA
ncbi:carbon-nitrogen hydrolase family protein [Campylobacter sp. MIT 99-7217]|uniref:carbon-nitrogen hydrolase family protein n=1 Tax=Campylobacter sp. MIT 99-7217 TaxID=535091 RepID=UPI00115AC6B9|nr:carbon-nitrogen hydrolase family protein [Campylobacter sp. MIT 99-7217]TQR33044.1 carbon-nitrogen hydrolase family protein [Campylobacter sp. MIT 99-7217]